MKIFENIPDFVVINNNKCMLIYYFAIINVKEERNSHVEMDVIICVNLCGLVK